MTEPAINTHNLTIDVGKHAGQLYTRLPVSYLRWMISVAHSGAAIAQAELDRRGTVNPELDISGHAVDRASLLAWHVYQETRVDHDEGLHAWLHRISLEARREPPHRAGVYLWRTLLLVFQEDTCWPVLKTVLPAKKRHIKEHDLAKASLPTAATEWADSK